ncbi:hypothetical protein ACFY1B_23295 [Streptomyces mirabilis]|uniref:hypothetical protein n=1 Tax=Streptomyces TaxID=1883 RepID=UPI0029A5AECD|nr:hypothetical protein [Streptomyces sp. AK02-04a]MDX3758368.1 hypothetical protein [Streptomyces sp. AK02-04a]
MGDGGVVRQTGVWGRLDRGPAGPRVAGLHDPPGGRKAIRKIYDIADGPHRVIGLIDAHGVNLAGES